MKTLRTAIAILALTPSLAFAGGHWGRYRTRYDYAQAYRGYGYGVRYVAPRPVVYVPLRPACAVPEPVVYRERAVNPVAIGVAAGLTTALVVASLAHMR